MRILSLLFLLLISTLVNATSLPPAVVTEGLANKALVHDDYLLLSKGAVKEHTKVFFIGSNQDVDDSSGPEDLNGKSGLHTFPTSAAVASISSSSANDDLTGTGARTVTIVGLDSSWDALTETVDLDGTTTVNSTGSFLRINQVYVASVGSGGDSAGSITIDVGGSGGSGTQAIILADESRADIGFYSVKDGSTLYLDSVCFVNWGLFGDNGGSGILMSKTVTTASTDIQYFDAYFGFKSEPACVNLRFKSYAERTDVKLRVNDVSTDNSKVSAYVSGVLFTP